MTAQFNRRETKMSTKKLPLMIALALSACSTAQPALPPANDQAARGTGAAEPPLWVPGPGAGDALQALWAAEPFGLDPTTLVRASGGVVPRMHDEETLLKETSFRLNKQGGSVDVSRIVWRILSDDPNQTVSLTWAPWHQERPQVRGRVVSANGTETTLDPTTIVAGSVVVDDLQISDVHQLQIPLPNAQRGSVVELQVTTTNTRGLIEGAGRTWSTTLWSLAPVRKQRYRVEAPPEIPLKVEAVGVPVPIVTTVGAVQRVELDVGELPFRPFSLTMKESRARMPRFGWSTAASWNDVALRYQKLIQPVFDDASVLKELGIKPSPTAEQAIQSVLRAVREKLRYTAVHLGDGAIVPSRTSVVLKRGYGDCKDLAVLVAAALREQKIDASVALTVANASVPRDELPGPEAFNHMVVVVKSEGKLTWIDATAPEFPVGTMPPGVRNQRALIIDAKTAALTATPTSDESISTFQTIYDLRFRSFSRGDAQVRSSGAGSAEGLFRSGLSRCDEAEARKIIQGDVQILFGDAPYMPAVTGCRPGDGPVVVTAEFKSTLVLDTGDQHASISLPSRVTDDLISDTLRGDQPGSDQRDEERRQEDDRTLREHSGRSEEEATNITWSFDARASSERIFRVTLPSHFTVATLPPTRTLQLGPSTLTEKARALDDGTIEVTFRYQLDKTDWSVEDVKAFRAAYWQRYEEQMPSLKASFEPVRLLEENRSPEAVALIRTWLTEKPKDGATRARYSRMLLQMGMGDLAKVEAERAWKDEPNDVLVNLVRGDVARHNAYGMMYEAPFERQKAIASFRHAVSLAPHHTWAVEALAQTLRRNDNGELELDWNQDVVEAAKLLQDMMDRGTASKEISGVLAEMYMRGHRFNELKQLIEQDPESRNSADRESQITMSSLSRGPEAALQAINRGETPKERLTGLVTGVGLFALMERYDDARKLLHDFKPGPALEREIAPLHALTKALKPVPQKVATDDPVRAARAIFATAAHATSPTALSRSLASMASKAGRMELDGTAKMLNLVQIPSLEPRMIWLWLYHGGVCTPTQVGRVVRVRCEIPENPAINVTSYWSREAKQLELESLGSFRQLAAKARAAAATKNLDEAGAWIDWTLDRLLAGGRKSNGIQLLRDYWSQAPRRDPGAVRFAAAQASVLLPSMARDADAPVLAELHHGRQSLSGSLKRRFDLHLAEIHEFRGDHAQASDLVKPIAESENEPWMWRWLAKAEADAGLSQQALNRIDKGLAADPGNVDWQQTRAIVLLRIGKYREAVKVLQGLRSEKGAAGVDVGNNLLWARLMSGDLADDMEIEARRMTAAESKDRASSAELHTAAMVLLGRGRVKDAAELARRLRSVSPDMDDAQWLLRGQLFAALGFVEQGHAAIDQMKGTDSELNDLARRFKKKP